MSGLIIFIKNPVLGKVKTRLAATIGDEKALLVYQQLLTRTEQITKNLVGKKYLFYSDFIDSNDFWDDRTFIKDIQVKGGLGEKIVHAVKKVFQENNRVIIIGSDCYDLTQETIEEAFSKLEDSDVVIGPANDGGYYLLGMNTFYPTLFTDINWSTDEVLSSTIEKINQQGLNYFLLPELIDVDTIEDLKTTELSY